jgi:hypothetical protein
MAKQNLGLAKLAKHPTIYFLRVERMATKASLPNRAM